LVFGAEMAGMAARAAITAAEAAIWRMDFISKFLWFKGEVRRPGPPKMHCLKTRRYLTQPQQINQDCAVVNN
jgi:hypothetical protein